MSPPPVRNEPPGKDPAAFRTIREVSEQLDVPQHVLRFWETRFPELKPLQRGGNRRYYRPSDVAFASALHKLLHKDGFTVKGVRKLISENGAANLVAIANGESFTPRGSKVPVEEKSALPMAQTSVTNGHDKADGGAPAAAGQSALLGELEKLRADLSAALGS